MQTEPTILFIISFNRLSFLKHQLEVLMREKRIKIIILDNASTYLPLLQFYDNIRHSIPIFTHAQNYGHTIPWKKGWTTEFAKDKPYFVTDCDIVPNKDNWYDILFEALNKYENVNKAGLGLYTGDIPARVPYRSEIIKHEEDYIHRKKLTDVRFEEAPVDTTLALYRGGYHKYSIWGTDKAIEFEPDKGCKSIRTTFPFVARHLSWYQTLEDLKTEENQYYLKSLQPNFTHWSGYQKRLAVKDYGNNTI